MKLFDFLRPFIKESSATQEFVYNQLVEMDAPAVNIRAAKLNLEVARNFKGAAEFDNLFEADIIRTEKVKYSYTNEFGLPCIAKQAYKVLLDDIVLLWNVDNYSLTVFNEENLWTN